MKHDLAPGTHLVSPRTGYQHHGIYVGGGRVIHYAGFDTPFRSGPVEEVTLDEFTRGEPVQVKVWQSPRFPGETAVKRARARLGEDRYSLWANNCEHFAEWCISGTSRSPQVDTSMKWLRGIFADLLARPALGPFERPLRGGET